MKKTQRAALEDVARYASATLDRAESASGAHLRIKDKQIAVAIVSTRRGVEEKPHLRFDKVALRFVRDLQGALQNAVPDGKTLILTITAPIRMASKTAGAFESQMKDRLVRGRAYLMLAETMQGNQMRARLVKGAKGASRVLGFVHNPNIDGKVLIEMAQGILDSIGEAKKTARPNPARDRWLVIIERGGHSRLDVWRHICSELSIPGKFGKILVCDVDGRIKDLFG